MVIEAREIGDLGCSALVLGVATLALMHIGDPCVKRPPHRDLVANVGMTSKTAVGLNIAAKEAGMAGRTI